MKKTRWLTLFMAGTFAILGVQFVTSSWRGLVFSYDFSDSRDPAAIPNVFDYSYLEGRPLKMFSPDRLLADAKVKVDTDGIDISLGHFVATSNSGHKRSACRLYTHVELTYIAEGVSVAGEPTIMKIKAPCKANQDVAIIGPLHLPMSKVYNEKVGDIELQFMGEQTIFFKIENAGDSWPTSWAISSIQLINNGTGAQHRVDMKQASPEKKKQLSFNWTPAQ